MSWDFITKNDVTIYLVSDAGDFYLVGQNENEFLITQEQGSGWSFINKN